MFVCGFINRGGYIYDDNNNMIHKETRNIGSRNIALDSTSVAKRMLLGAVEDTLPIIMALADHGGVESLWVNKDDHEEIQQRLRIWSGCYGSWPLHILSED